MTIFLFYFFRIKVIMLHCTRGYAAVIRVINVCSNIIFIVHGKWSAYKPLNTSIRRFGQSEWFETRKPVIRKWLTCKIVFIRHQLRSTIACSEFVFQAEDLIVLWADAYNNTRVACQIVFYFFLFAFVPRHSHGKRGKSFPVIIQVRMHGSLQAYTP